MPASPVTARTLALRCLRLLGIVSLDPATPANQAFPIEPTDLDDVLGVMNSSIQEYMEMSPTGEVRAANLGEFLNPPTTVSLSLTYGSTTITSFTGFQQWMTGCTIRCGGDRQDNEVTSIGLLVRPFMGSTSSAVSCTVYGDAVQLDDTIGKIIDPVTIPNQVPLTPCATRMEFAMMAGYPVVVGPGGGVYGMYPFFWFVQKSVSRPWFYFIESAYYTGIAYVPRRIRVAPMPDQAYPLSFVGAMNPTRLQASDIDNGDHVTDPGTLIPIDSTRVESILMKICAKNMTELATFKNSDAVPGIESAFKRAVSAMENIRGQASGVRGAYCC